MTINLIFKLFFGIQDSLETLNLKLNNKTKLIFSFNFYKSVDIQNDWLQTTQTTYIDRQIEKLSHPLHCYPCVILGHYSDILGKTEA